MCDTLVTLTDDGVLFAKNSDRDVNEAQYLDWQPARSHQPGATLRCTWIDIPQVAMTRATLLSRPWWTWGAEMGANDAGVVIGNEGVFTHESVRRRRSDQPTLLGMDLLRLGLERASSAQDAIGVIVDLLERYGQGGPHSHSHPGFDYDNSFIVADASSAFVLETAGREWAVEPVAGGGSRSISNGLTIEPFASAHSNRLRTTVGEARKRCALTTNGARTARGPSTIAATLRGHGPSGSIAYSPANGALSAPCVHPGGLLTSSQTVASWISQLGDGVRHWATATSAPCTSVFKPVSVDVPVDLGPRPDDHFDANTTWWRHEVLHRLAVRDLDRAVSMISPERDALEAEWFETPPPAAEAFGLASESEDRWLTQLLDAGLVDHRPWLVGRFWRSADVAAGMPVPERRRVAA